MLKEKRVTRSYRADFGKTAEDYATHRAGFPDRFFDAAADRGLGLPGQRLLDLGTGTGTLARGFAARGAQVTGLDIAPAILDQARHLAAEAGLSTTRFQQGSAEATGQDDHSFDRVTAGQCWHWFDGPKAFAEVRRVLKPGGVLMICHFDWLPLAGNVVEATEALILTHSPDWPFGGGTGFYPAWAKGMAEAGFQGIETFSFDVEQPYSHDAWRGRIRASAPIGGTLAPDAVAVFDQAHGAMLAQAFPQDPLLIPHRCWAVTAISPE